LSLDKRSFMWYIIVMRGYKIKQGTQVRHRDNPQWNAVIVKDLDPDCPVNGSVRYAHTSPLGTVYIGDMPKGLLEKVNG
jgi:hypothetical protein